MKAETRGRGTADNGKSGKPGKSEKPRKSGSAGPISVWIFLGLTLLIAGAVIVGLRVAVGVELDAPTLALALSCVALIWALRALWGMVAALARPATDTLLGEHDTSGSSLSELREEKRRVLRAIKELEFDHGMGKLSDADFKAVSERYKLRAIQVMRELDGSDAVHPLLLEHIEGARAPVPQEPRS